MKEPFLSFTCSLTMGVVIILALPDPNVFTESFQSCTVPIAVYQQAVVRYKFFGFRNLKNSNFSRYVFGCILYSCFSHLYQYLFF